MNLTALLPSYQFGRFQKMQRLPERFRAVSMALALLTGSVGLSHADTVNFNSDTGDPGATFAPYPRTAPFTSVDSPNVSFSAPTGTSMDPALTGPINTAFPDQALQTGGGANSSIVLDFTGPVSALSLDFQGDVPIAGPGAQNFFDEARLIGFNGTSQVVSSSVTPDFINAYLVTAPQNIGIAYAAGITRAVFAFYQGGTQATLGSEVIDNVMFTLIPLAAAAPDAVTTRPDSGAAPAVGATGGGGGRAARKPAPFILADNGAILSAETTGLLIPVVQRQVLQSASNGAIRDLNSRLFRARSGGEVGPGHEFAGASGGTLVRFLNFADSIGVDADETMIDVRSGRGVAVSVHDTLMTGGAVMTVGPGGKSVVNEPGFQAKGVITPEPAYAYNRFEIFTEFDYGFYDQDNLTSVVRGFRSDTYSGSVGAEYRLAPWLHIGGAFTYLESDTDVANSYGNIDLEGTLLSAYATVFHGNFYVDTLYSFGQFDHDIRRNTLLGRSANGDTESETHNIDVNLGYNIPLTKKVIIGPTLGVNYATGDIDGYTETGGRNANLIFNDDDFESTIGRLGGQISYTTDTSLGKVTLQGRVGWAHEFSPENDSVSAELENSPFLLVNGSNVSRTGGYTAQGNGAHVGEDWLELGTGVRLELGRRWSMQLDYEGQFGRDNAEAHFVGLKLSYEWGTEFLSALR